MNKTWQWVVGIIAILMTAAAVIAFILWRKEVKKREAAEIAPAKPVELKPEDVAAATAAAEVTQEAAAQRMALNYKVA